MSELKFTKKPITIEAIKASEAIRCAKEAWIDLPAWLRNVYDQGGVVFTDTNVTLPTLEGTMIAGFNDWIICGVKGEVYPCKPDIFEATYEPTNTRASVNLEALAEELHEALFISSKQKRKIWPDVYEKEINEILTVLQKAREG